MYRNRIDDKADFRPYRANFWISLIFITLFVFFVYGGMALVLLEFANMFIHSYQIPWLIALGKWGLVLTVLAFVAAWISLFLLPASLFRWLLYRASRVRLANKIFVLLMFIGCNIFLLPMILWPVVRRSSPYLRAKRYNKLKALLANPKLVELRRRERELQAKYLLKHRQMDVA